MIAYLKGDFVFKSPALVYVDVNGVAYEVHISLNTFSKIQDLYFVWIMGYHFCSTQVFGGIFSKANFEKKDPFNI